MSLNLINRLFERYNDVIINQTVMAERSVNSEINVMWVTYFTRLFASLISFAIFLNHEIGEVNVSRKFHVIRYIKGGLFRSPPPPPQATLPVNSLAVHLSGPYCKIQTAKETNQISPFHLGPFQSHSKRLYEPLVKSREFYYYHTWDWNAEWRCVKNGCLVASARTLLSTIVHSTSSSSKTTSFFSALIA